LEKNQSSNDILDFILYTFKFIIKIFFRGKCYNRKNIPKNGPFIGIINHRSLFEIPAALTLAFKHRAATMVKHSLFSVRVLGGGKIAVDMLEMKAMMNLLSGHLVY